MKVSDVYTSYWLKADDLQGAPRRVRILEVTTETFKQQDGKEETKIVASFLNKSKRLVINRINAQSLCNIFNSDNTDEWRSGEILLSPGIASNGKPTINVSALPTGDGEENPF